MSNFLILIVFIFTVFFARRIFQKWFNPISVYSFAWFFVLSLYELKLMSYISLSSLTWFTIIIAFLAFSLGSLTIVVSYKYYKPKNFYANNSKTNDAIFEDDGKIIKNAIILFSIIGFLAAIQHWYILFQKYGSLAEILFNANKIYRLRTEGKLDEVWGYIFIVPYAGIFLSGLFVAFKSKLTYVAILPFFAIVLKELANISRAGMLIAFFLFISAFFLYRNRMNSSQKKISLKSKLKILFSVIVVAFLIFAAATIVKTSRGAFESFSASSSTLKKYKEGIIFTPSVYLYFSSHVGVLSKYIDDDFESKTGFGEFTFQPIYNFLSKFELVKHPPFYEKGYFIPMWTNTGTYLRYIHADFGEVGILIFPYFLGFITTFYWFRYYKTQKLIYLVFLSYLFVLIMYSFVTIISRTATWLLSLLLTGATVYLVELYLFKFNKSHN